MGQVTILGAGTWGSALANVLAENGHQVTLWTRSQEQATELEELRTNEHYLNDFHLHANVTATSDLSLAVQNAQIIGFVVPTKAIRQVALGVVEVLTTSSIATPPLIFHATKGIEQQTHLRVSEMLEDEFQSVPYQGIVALSGPSHAEEVATHHLTAITSASKDEASAQVIQSLFMNQYLRVYTSTDIIGVELGGALKNIIGLCAGVSDGLNYGINTKAALVTRGLAEITRLGVALGADPLTFSGLSGVGDLIVTTGSSLSRNWRCGYAIGQGVEPKQAIAETGQIVEGVTTTNAAYELAKCHEVEMPITEAMYQVLNHHSDLRTIIANLMGRSMKSERVLPTNK
ncbi:MAG: NAD(P)H-dependent glycerol-3-phosphate dehydrogenase [Aerococcus sp.]|nr:NAD(P)H-dependent glycerol-3-phosphate dehydrogenase [Aerococcus sp.]